MPQILRRARDVRSPGGGREEMQNLVNSSRDSRVLDGIWGGILALDWVLVEEKRGKKGEGEGKEKKRGKIN